ncbi:MAG TPA: hypothetical protein VFC19_00580 [Candidatus Limnocylindrales bacterium]|nr:hypothetical protein [Candidatus Limnocylindrales bacterium]
MKDPVISTPATILASQPFSMLRRTMSPSCKTPATFLRRRKSALHIGCNGSSPPNDGILAEYPHGGAYDIAVREGRCTLSKAHHGTTDHVAGFSPGLRDHVAGFSPGLRYIHLTDGRPD